MFMPFGLFVRMLANGGTSEQEIRREYPQVGRRDLQTLLAYARSLPTDLEYRFHLLMPDSYWVCGNFTKGKTANGKGYWPNYQLRSVRKYGGLQAVRRYLANPRHQQGFDTTRILDMIEFSIEAMVIQQPWSNLFTRQELEIARSRLAAAGDKPSEAPPGRT